MFVRIEKLKNSEDVLVVDELNRFLGVISEETFFEYCVDRSKESFLEDDYTFYYVNQNQLFNLISAQKR